MNFDIKNEFESTSEAMVKINEVLCPVYECSTD